MTEHDAFKRKRHEDRLLKLMRLSAEREAAVRADPVEFLKEAYDRLNATLSCIETAISALNGMLTPPASDVEPIRPRNMGAEATRRNREALEILRRARD